MAAEGGNNIVWFTYTGADGENIPQDATHIFVDVKIIPAWAFAYNSKIVEIICHDKVEKIEEYAFRCCRRLRRVIMRGVKIAERYAVADCSALTDVECGKLDIVGEGAFIHCKSLRSINLPSARTLGELGFFNCKVLTDVNFGSKLERIEGMVFRDCYSLERITIPLKDGIITHDNIFGGCENLKHVDLVEGALREIIASLHFEKWRNDTSEKIDSINQILPDAHPGGWDDDIEFFVEGEKAQVIRGLIRSVLDKMVHYQAEHRRLLDEAATTIELALPRDIVMKNVLSFLELPPHSFGVEDHEDGSEEDDSEEDDDSDGEEMEVHM